MLLRRCSTGRERHVIFKGAMIMKIQKGQVIEELAYKAKPRAGAVYE